MDEMKNLMSAIKAITLVCAISSSKSEAGIPDPIIAKAFGPLTQIANELKENNPEVDFEQLDNLITTCEIEVNEAIITLKARAKELFGKDFD